MCRMTVSLQRLEKFQSLNGVRVFQLHTIRAVISGQHFLIAAYKVQKKSNLGKNFFRKSSRLH